MAYFISALLGFMLGGLAMFYLNNAIKPDISAEELYRFCIERKIDLPKCKIPPFPLPKEIIK